MNLEQYAAQMRQAIADGMVKVGIPTGSDNGPSMEWCWAERLSPTHAKLCNCCVFRDDIGFGDIVEFREQGDDEGGPHDAMKLFVRVVTRGSTQCQFMYSTVAEARDESPAAKEALTLRLRSIRQSLESLPEDVRPISFEGLFAGFACAAFPASVTPAQAEAFLGACPFVIEQHAGIEE